jgi:hypothetical protein
MKPKQQILLLHPAFLLSLFILLLNDFYLKYTYHNWLTGKLSDFTGLFVFTIFLFALVPFRRIPLLCFSAMFFCWWKSGFSDSLIFFFRSTLQIPVTRVIDYSDLTALLILPLTYFIKTPDFSTTKIRSVAINASAIISFFTFCATSLPRQLIYYPYRENEILFKGIFYSPLSKTEILERFDPRKEGYKKDSVRFYRVTEYEDLYYRIKENNDSLTQWLPLTNTRDSSLFIKKPGTEFYTIPTFVLQGDTLYNLEFNIYPSGKNKKATKIVIESFQTNNYTPYKYYSDGKYRKNYKKYFNRLFSK